MDDYLENDDDPEKWKKFHNTTREYVIFLLLFISLYLVAYFFICLYKKRLRFYQVSYEDAISNRIALWLSCFSLSISIGATLLLPISIISNEVLLLYPNSYYVQWLNSSLIQGVWNLVFLFSNVSLFLLLPFSHFIMESEGFPGSSKGIMARVNEALLVLGLTGLVIMGIIYILSAMFYEGPIVCTPVGFGRLFSVMAELLKIVKIPPHINVPEGATSLIEEEPPPSFNVADYYPRPSQKEDNDVISAAPPLPRTTGLYHRVPDWQIRIDKLAALSFNCPEEEPFRGSFIADRHYSRLEREQNSFSIRRNCIHPFVMLILLLLTILSVLIVVQNTLELCFGIKSLPVYSQNLSLGISSLSTLGPIGAALEIVMILYLWCSSVVGLYSLPLFGRLKPKAHDTSLTQIIGNCAVLLVLSSAFPVLARSLGITNFDLLGEFGRINWLGNFYIVVFHNLVFTVTVVFCLGTKITASVRSEIYQRLRSPFTKFL